MPDMNMTNGHKPSIDDHRDHSVHMLDTNRLGYILIASLHPLIFLRLRNAHLKHVQPQSRHVLTIGRRRRRPSDLQRRLR